jgi:hypothetical protein
VDIAPDSIFNFDEYFEKQDKWVKAEITQSALAEARNNVQTLNMYDDELYNRKKNLNKYTMERHKKYTLSLAVLIFFFIGAPLGAIIRKGGLGMPVVYQYFVYCLLYCFHDRRKIGPRRYLGYVCRNVVFNLHIFTGWNLAIIQSCHRCSADECRNLH